MTNKTSEKERHNCWQIELAIGKIMTLGDFVSALESYDLPRSMDKDFFKSQLERMKNAEKDIKNIRHKDVMERAEESANKQNFACTESVIKIVRNDMEKEILEKWGFSFDEKTGTLIDERLRSAQKSEAIYGPDYVSYIHSINKDEDEDEDDE